MLQRVRRGDRDQRRARGKQRLDVDGLDLWRLDGRSREQRDQRSRRWLRRRWWWQLRAAHRLRAGGRRGRSGEGHLPANDPLASYPGDAYVDCIGTDSYGSDYQSYNYNSNTKGTPAEIWQESLSPLSDIKSFASSRGKPCVVSEWGMMIRADGHGSNDSEYVMQQYITWLGANCYYHTYFNADDHPKGTTKVATFAAAGATSLTLNNASIGFGTSPNNPVGFLRYGTGNGAREIDYTSRNTATNVISGIPASGHGSIPAGGLAVGVKITEAIQNMCQLAVGSSDGDIEEGDQGFRDNPHLPLSAAAYRAGIK